MRTDPIDVVVCSRTAGQDGQNELNVLSGQPAEIEISGIYATFIRFTEGPEGLDWPRANSVIQPVSYIAVDVPGLTPDRGAEAIPTLYCHGRIDSLDISVIYILRSYQQAWNVDRHASLRNRRILPQNETLDIVLCARAGPYPSTGIPLRRTIIFNEIIGRCTGTGASYFDLDPEGSIRSGSDPKWRVGSVPELPIATISPGRIRRGQRNGEVNGLAG